MNAGSTEQKRLVEIESSSPAWRPQPWKETVPFLKSLQRYPSLESFL
jgi:hypothetical protein